AACTRCDACVRACLGKIIVRGGDGFPRIDFAHGECTFCGDCVGACAPGALVRAHQGSTPWLLKAAITQNCLAYKELSCSSCGDTCSRRAIRFRSREGAIPVPEVDRRLCKGCGACLAWCAVAAITVSSAPQAKPRPRAPEAALRS
ncbi:MAG: ferredoxin-type protein NapF, partial [Betaproteobacteria bacterium]|nr:ferredoxin-type protein NapF [Betaproteobacteria bacterium]